MPRVAPRTDTTAPRVLRAHERRLDAIETRKPLGPAPTMPTQPVVGQRALLQHTTGHWALVWNGTGWEDDGGRDLFARTDAETTYSSNVYPASPQGPSVSIPRAGTYDITFEARHRHSHTGILFTSVAFGPTGSSNAFLVAVERAPVIAAGAQIWQRHVWEGISLSVGLLHAWHRAPNGGAINTHYAFRKLSVRPVLL